MDLTFGPRNAGASEARFGSPPRQLSPPLRDWALRHGAAKIRWWLLAIIGLANMLGGVMFITAYFGSRDTYAQAEAQADSTGEGTRQHLQEMLAQPDLPAQARAAIVAAQNRLAPVGHRNRSSAEWLLWGGLAWIAFDALLIGGIVAWAKARGARRGRQMLVLLESGRFGTARVLANQVDYSIQLNGAPRRLVALEIGGQPRQIKTFDNNYANLFPQGALIEVLYASDPSGMVFPTAAIPVV